MHFVRDSSAELRIEVNQRTNVMWKEDQRRIDRRANDREEKCREQSAFPWFQHVQGRIQQILQIKPMKKFEETTNT